MEDTHYTWNSEEYARNSSAQFTWAREIIGKLGLRGNESVLDVGCGDGKITAYIAEMLPGGRTIGIDSSPEMILQAAKTFPVERYPNLSFRHMDARSIELEERFDVVFSNSVLHWVNDHQSFLRGVKGCLKPSGRMLFQMGGKGNAKTFFDTAEHIISRDAWKGFFHGFTFPFTYFELEEYRKLLFEAGFDALRVELLFKDMRHAGKNGLAGFVRAALLPYTQRVPEGLRETFINELVDAYIHRHPPDDEGLVHLDAMRMEVDARHLQTRPMEMV